MGWREDIIAHYTKEIADLEEGISLMEAGVLEVRSRTATTPWVNDTPAAIARDKETISVLRGIIAKAEQGEV